MRLSEEEFTASFILGSWEVVCLLTVMGPSFPKLQLLHLIQDPALGWGEAGVSMEGKRLALRISGF